MLIKDKGSRVNKMNVATNCMLLLCFSVGLNSDKNFSDDKTRMLHNSSKLPALLMYIFFLSFHDYLLDFCVN